MKEKGGRGKVNVTRKWEKDVGREGVWKGKRGKGWERSQEWEREERSEDRKGIRKEMGK